VSRLADTEINRAANALLNTLNDQRVEEFDAARFTAICGQTVLRDITRPAKGWVVDGRRRLIEIERVARGRWSVRRLVGPRSTAYVPPEAGDERARGGAVAPHAFCGAPIVPDVGDPVSG
jgi:hypothetical protein